MTPSEDGHFIEVVVVGEVTRTDALELTEAQFALGRDLGIQCFLVNATKSPNVSGVYDNVRFTLGDVPAVPPPDLRARTAVLIDPADHSHDFYVAFAQSQGLDIALFWDRENAIEWLQEAPGHDSPHRPLAPDV